MPTTCLYPLWIIFREEAHQSVMYSTIINTYEDYRNVKNIPK